MLCTNSVVESCTHDVHKTCSETDLSEQVILKCEVINRAICAIYNSLTCSIMQLANRFMAQ